MIEKICGKGAIGYNMDTVDAVEQKTEEINENAENIEDAAAGADAPAAARNMRKERTGMVVSNKMDKTAVVKITESVKHGKYSKILKRSIKFKVHDENNECDVGDKVLIMETRPLSRDKHFRLVRILEKVK